uniref:Uncharacterized protein n=1 Tax=Mustela putorius furo TaxID=9669 RepID=M3Y5U2_MUSPF
MLKMGPLSAMPVVSGTRNTAPAAPAAGWCPGKVCSPRSYVADAACPWAPTKARLRKGIPGGRPRPRAPESLSRGAAVPLSGPWSHQVGLSLPSENVLSSDTPTVDSNSNKESNDSEKGHCDLGIPPHAHFPPSPVPALWGHVFSLGF